MSSSPPNKRPPCPTHGLATGPDGQCTLCRRAARPPAEPQLPVSVAVDDVGSRLVTRLLGIGLLLSITGGAAYAFNTWSGGMFGAGASLGPEPPARGIVRREPPKPEPHPQQLVAGAGAAAADTEPLRAEPPADAPAALTAEEIERTRRQELETAEQDRRRSEQIKADFEARARKRARANVSITLYSTSWCPSCTAAREYMTREGILFTEHDIEQSESARMIMHRLNPRKSIPTIDIDGAVLVGFSSNKIEDAIDTAVKKRTGG